MKWSTQQVRRTFKDFFERHQHLIVDSAPIVIKDDPTLMFTNAGMNQFKAAFLGNEEPPAKRVANSQKCLRVSGKHNDLEEVGRDHYHHTMFEMLGNWSFGDYFKKDAIAFAWTLLTEEYGLNPDRLYVSVFGGDSELGISSDDEAVELWKMHIDSDRILSFGRKDNFWEMGETGPCGPCSEIHIDMRSDEERAQVSGAELVNQDHEEVIEIWNLVFMEFNHQENGDLVPLKDQHIDTGMGLERIARVLQGVKSNYEIDVFKALIQKTGELSGKTYNGSDSEQDTAFRVIADHIRTIAFCIADGQLPSSTGAGYVIRRVLRRAIRYGFSQLDCKEPYLSKLVDVLADQMGEDYPELKTQQKLIKQVINEEELSFLQTLEKGLEKLAIYFKKQKSGVVDGGFAFELYDTYGFPIDLTSLIAAENHFKLDEAGFEKELNAQKERSRNAGKTSFGDWVLVSEEANSQFLGYDQLEANTKVCKYRKAKVKNKDVWQVVLAKTPFYAESGGQIGDQGSLTIGNAKVNIFDTKKENGEILHFTSDALDHVDLSANVVAVVNGARREEIMKNHSATHLMHFALREALGDHVEQKGSLVAPDRLRFDFSHFNKMSEEELSKVEQRVNELILADQNLEEWREMPVNEAKAMGAMALFGEKYGDNVRVVKYGESIELCGGTHVRSTADIGGFKFIGETSVASGVRRVEAITGKAYRSYVDDAMQTMHLITEKLGNPEDVLKAIDRLVEENKISLKKLQAYADREKQDITSKLESKIARNGEFSVLIEELSFIGGKVAKEAVYTLSLNHQSFYAVVGGVENGKPYLIVALSKDLVEKTDLDANKIIRTLAPHIDGGGGGQKFLAMAGGKNEQGLRRALENADEIIRIQAS